MPSAHATYFNAKARPQIWAAHAETVELRQAVGGTVDLRGVFKRSLPDNEGDTDGVGAQGYRGTATMVILVADFPMPPGNGSLIVRNGEEWAVRHPERQDEWTWILHLARPDAERVMPVRGRR